MRWGMPPPRAGGYPVTNTALSKARATYRHDVVALKPEHFDAMRAGIGLAWFLGLVWLCQEIGVPKQVLQECARRDLFHRARRTALELWGKPSPA
jgi:hypothetical protein